jgi:gas vesicle protein GvpK
VAVKKPKRRTVQTLHRPAPRRSTPPVRRPKATTPTPAAFDVQEIESLRAEVRRLAASPPPRWNANPENVRRSVAKLVLTLIEFIRQILERQAIRRMDAGTLTPEETESVGLALMRLEETIEDLASQFGLAPEDLTIDLGPLGRLT